MYRQTDKETDVQADTCTGGQTRRQMYRQTDKETDEQADKETDVQADRRGDR